MNNFENVLILNKCDIQWLLVWVASFATLPHFSHRSFLLLDLALSLSYSRSLTYTLYRSCSLAHTLLLTLSVANALLHMLSHSRSQSHILTLLCLRLRTLPYLHKSQLNLSLYLFPALSLSLTHTRTHTHTHFQRTFLQCSPKCVCVLNVSYNRFHIELRSPLLIRASQKDSYLQLKGLSHQ